MTTILRMLLVLGLTLSPLYPRTFASGDHSVSGTSLASEQAALAADEGSDVALCHEGNMDCGKSCPCMSACMSLSVQGLPSGVTTVGSPAGISERLAISSELQLASHTDLPPARPPRA